MFGILERGKKCKIKSLLYMYTHITTHIKRCRKYKCYNTCISSNDPENTTMKREDHNVKSNNCSQSYFYPRFLFALLYL